jgi:ParB-like chromosome segregation protein Spo0J
MRKHGYDESQPITGVRREDGRIVISDGHHRVEAAIRAGIAKVPVDVHEHKGA